MIRALKASRRSTAGRVAQQKAIVPCCPPSLALGSCVCLGFRTGVATMVILPLPMAGRQGQEASHHARRWANSGEGKLCLASPKGLRNIAQGCGAAATLGFKPRRPPNPNGVS